MSRQTLWQYLARWSGGARMVAESKRTTATPAPKPKPAVLEQALSDAVITAPVRCALDDYRAALKDLKQGGATYRAGALEAAQAELHKLPLPTSLGATLQILTELFDACIDVIFRGTRIGGKRPALLLYIDGMSEAERLERFVLDPLSHWGDPDTIPAAPKEFRAWLESTAVAVTQTEPLATVGQVVDVVLGGDGVLLVDGATHGLSLGVRSWEHRAVEEPAAEPVIRGPREGFTETIRVNTMLLRRRLKTPHLKIERIVLGRRTQTLVDVVYVKDLAAPDLVAEVRRRLRSIDIDGVIDSGTIEELIEDQPSSVFPQVGNTERPDRVVAALLEGRVAILVDGSPFALMAPVTLWSLMQASEDYYERFWIATFLRWLRYLFLIIALLGPSLYVAVTTYHQEMLPTALLLSIAASREGIPFPALVEAFLMELFFEALREAGVRLPRPVGQAVSIVGALVIGQSAVTAGLASAPIVIIVASTGIASFTIPRFNLGIAFRLLRFPMIMLAGTLGLYGIMIGLTAVLVHLCALRSFGTPYLEPMAPFGPGSFRDVLLRAPTWLAGRRPPIYGTSNPQRQKTAPRAEAGGGRP